MDIKNIKELVKIAKEEGLAELRYESEKEKFLVKLPFASAPAAVSVAPQAVVSTSTAAPAATQSSASSDVSSGENLHEIRSPFVGTYYKCPAPGEPPYVNVGDKVSPGKVLCILEAMKIMNEIESDVSGELVEICVENESLVEFGQVIFKIRKS